MKNEDDAEASREAHRKGFKDVFDQTHLDDRPPEVRKFGSDPTHVYGKYTRVEKLGQGGMGEVWRAWDKELRRWVALKFLMHDDTDELARFRREAQTAGKLSHPNIASVFEVGQAQGKHYIAMQFVEGQTLDNFPRDDARLLVELMRDAAIAVHAAHEQGVIHRDLKPGNIMVEGKPGPTAKTARKGPGQSRTQGLRLFVMDFGLAKSLAVESSLSATGAVVGTPTYMSPEQAKASRDLDSRCDVYSLGATLYSILADRAPFKGENVYDVLKKVVEEEPKPLRKLKPRLDEDLETIVMKCLEKDRARRYATALELADDLSRWLDGEAIQAHPPSLFYRARKFAGKRKGVLWMGCAGLLAVGGVAAILVPPWLDERRRREEAEFYLPLERDLDGLRMNFYRPDYELTEAEFEKYEALEGRIRAQMDKAGESALGWYVMGRCREVRADYAGADEAYGKAMALDKDHPRTLLARGRMRMERALMARLSAGGDKHRPLEEASEALNWVERGSQRGEPGMELDLASAYLEVITGFGKRAYSASAMLEKWKSERYAEEFLLLEGISGGGKGLAGSVEEVLAKMPSSFTALFWRGVSRFQKSDYDGAIKDYDRALKINPRFAEAYLGRGDARLANRDYKGAIEDYTEALKSRPEDAIAHYNRGLARQSNGDIDHAINDYGEAIKYNSQFAHAYSNRGALRNTQNDHPGAIEDCTEAIRINPRFAMAYVNRSYAKHDMRDYRGAIEDCTKALEIDPRLADAYTNRGAARQAVGEIVGAIDDYTEALKSRPGDAIAHYNRGLARQANKDSKGAIDDYTEAIKINPRFAKAYFSRGVARYTAGEFGLAIEDFTEAIKNNQEYAEAYSGRGDARQASKDYKGAIDDYTEAIRINPRFATTYYNRGITRHAVGDLDHAIQDFDDALRINPGFADAYYNRALARYNKKEYQLAIEDFTEAINNNPQYAEAYSNRAVARIQTEIPENLRDAERDCTKAIELNPQMATAFINRGNARCRLGEFANGLRDYDDAIALKETGDAYAGRGIEHWKFADKLDGEARRRHLLLAKNDFEEALKRADLSDEWRTKLESDKGLPMLKQILAEK